MTHFDGFVLLHGVADSETLYLLLLKQFTYVHQG